jgi:hypothetical protein
MGIECFLHVEELGRVARHARPPPLDLDRDDVPADEERLHLRVVRVDVVLGVVLAEVREVQGRPDDHRSPTL